MFCFWYRLSTFYLNNIHIKPNEMKKESVLIVLAAQKDI